MLFSSVPVCEFFKPSYFPWPHAEMTECTNLSLKTLGELATSVPSGSPLVGDLATNSQVLMVLIDENDHFLLDAPGFTTN